MALNSVLSQSELEEKDKFEDEFTEMYNKIRNLEKTSINHQESEAFIFNARFDNEFTLDHNNEF